MPVYDYSKFSGRLADPEFRDDSDEDIPGNQAEIDRALASGDLAPSTMPARGLPAVALGSANPDSTPGPDAVAAEDTASSMAKMLRPQRDMSPQVTQADLDAAVHEKKRQNLYAALADAAANGQSFGSFFLGRQTPHVDAGAAFRNNAELADQGIKNKQILQKQALDQPKLQASQDLMDKDSDLSNSKRSFAKLGIENLTKSGLFSNNQAELQKLSASMDNMSGAEIDALQEKIPLLKTAAESLRTNAMLAGVGIRKEGLETKKDEQAARAGDKVTNDTMIKTQTQQLALAQRADEMLSKGKLTVQEFNDIQQEVANAISGAKSAALGKLERTEYDSIQGKLAGIKQMWTGQPQDAVPPEILDRVRQLNKAFLNSVAQHRLERAESLRRGYQHNSMAQDEQGKVISGFQGSLDDQEPPQGPAVDPKIDQWAKQHGLDYQKAESILKSRGYGQ